MVAHILRLTIGEWRKTRRRWVPWILLGILLLIFQGILWGSYAVYHAGDDPLGALVAPFEHSDSDGTIEVTCRDVVEGRSEEKFALIAGRLTEEEREGFDERMAQWGETCQDYRTPDEARQAFTLPRSIGSVAEGTIAIFAIPILILAALVMGVEYGWGTLRATLARGVGRWQLLSGKLIMLIAAGIGGVIVVGALNGIASLLAGVIPPGEAGSLIISDSGAWLDALKGLARLAFALAPYVALGVFLSVLTQSTAQGLALSLGYYIIELVLVPVLGGLADWLENIMDVALLGPNAAEWLPAGPTTEIQRAMGVVAEQQDDTLRAFFVLLAYTAALIAASVWVFQRRDIAGARGE